MVLVASCVGDRKQMVVHATRNIENPYQLDCKLKVYKL